MIMIVRLHAEMSATLSLSSAPGLILNRLVMEICI